jgi:hypothetical protein
MMTEQRHKRAIGTFANHPEAEMALHELRDSDFPMDKISVVGQDLDRHANMAGAEGSDRLSDLAKDNKADQGAKAGVAAGGTLGGITGLLVGLGMVAIPGVGPVMLAGAGATALVTALAGGAIGAATGGIFGGLVGLGIPEDHARTFSDRVDRGDYLVMVDGSETEIEWAESILRHRGINDWSVYDNDPKDAQSNYYPAGTLYKEGTVNPYKT